MTKKERQEPNKFIEKEKITSFSTERIETVKEMQKESRIISENRYKEEVAKFNKALNGVIHFRIPEFFVGLFYFVFPKFFLFYFHGMLNSN